MSAPLCGVESGGAAGVRAGNQAAVIAARAVRVAEGHGDLTDADDAFRRCM